MKNLISATLLAICLYACNSASDTKTSDHPEIKNKAVSIAYKTAGTSDTAIVFVHGWAINKGYWQAQQEYFSPRFKTVALDLAGHGESGKNRTSFTPEEYAKDVIAVINGLQLKKVILVGHSMSGQTILEVAKTIPENIIGLIGVDNFKTIVTSFGPDHELALQNFIQSFKDNYDSVATNYCYQGLFPYQYKDSVPMKRVANDILAMDHKVSIAALEASIKGLPKQTKLLSETKLPLYIIQTDLLPMHDSLVRTYVKGGLNVKNVRGVGHYPMIEKPAEFNQRMEEAINVMVWK